MSTVAITGWSVHVPGIGDACRAGDAAQLLGRKGLLYKEPATRLALCAVHRALGWAPGTRRVPGSAPHSGTAVVASSNLGNVDTVCTVARAVRDSGVRAISPLDAPNVSSNVIASTVAIWFGFGGPNLMVCSGHPSGLDAIRLAALLLVAGRATRAVVVGVEPGDPTATALLPSLQEAAACVILERIGSVLLGPIEDVVDGGRGNGRSYGANGVLQVAAAAAEVTLNGGAARVVCGDQEDGHRAVTLTHIGALP